MVLIDTSIWVKFLAGDHSSRRGMDDLLQHNEVLGHELVYGELLMGDRGGRLHLLSDYQRMHQAASVPHDEVVEFVRHRRLHGRGIGWIDVHLLASAVVGRCRLWTADPRFAAIADELKVGHSPG